MKKEVPTGLQNNVGMIEITYGLSDGERAILDDKIGNKTGE
jgi:hypothetical protein